MHLIREQCADADGLMRPGGSRHVAAEERSHVCTTCLNSFEMTTATMCGRLKPICRGQALTDATPASRISCDSARSSTARARTIAPTSVAYTLMAFLRRAAFDVPGTSFTGRSTTP